jgi:regulator of replication initiation timing
MRRLSDEAPSESPVIEIHEKQWMVRNWLLGGLVLAVLVLSGLIYAGIRVNENREQRNRSVAAGTAGKFVADLQDAMRQVDAKTTDKRIAGIAAAVAESSLAQAGVEIARMSAGFAKLEREQEDLATNLVSLQEHAVRLTSENEKLRAELAASDGRIVAFQAQRLADSLALAEQNASWNRRLSTVADQTADVDRRVGKSSTTLRGIGGVTAANVAVGLIHLLGTKQANDVRPTTATVGQ